MNALRRLAQPSFLRTVGWAAIAYNHGKALLWSVKILNPSRHLQTLVAALAPRCAHRRAGGELCGVLQWSGVRRVKIFT
jgi:hypothetical protein